MDGTVSKDTYKHVIEHGLTKEYVSACREGTPMAHVAPWHACGFCHYWTMKLPPENYDGTLGMCRRLAPRPQGTEDSHFPQVFWTCWCGDFEKRA